MTTDERLTEIQVAVGRIEERLGALPCKEHEAKLQALSVNGAEVRGMRRGALIGYSLAAAAGGAGGLAAILKVLGALR